MRQFLILLTSLFLLACSSNIDDYQTSQPEFKLEDYFNGDILAWGILQDYSNKVTRKFTVEIKANWQGNTGTLDEFFTFDDGETQSRIWTITKLENGLYRGSANDVVGTAEIKQQGSAVNLQYQLKVPIDNSTYTFTIDDWMYRFDEKRVFNRSKLYKFGIEVAEITLFFEKI
ncbi:DUF3833 domain-containing protein [Catenovulum sp. 2E275]|uniref:DUF3833 domain-containing protein n=1 Tax=Catenovulum sp. 2E275 TaxID=2980497 RepID=UPI0021CFBD21|nr:DUF3833 domain-containing protein [Catenovulum sp. 2E275]MCU4676854.1 DUF3833 domain-containing protein [Catenovulum sp. 2E275]